MINIILAGIILLTSTPLPTTEWARGSTRELQPNEIAFELELDIPLTNQEIMGSLMDEAIELEALRAKIQAEVDEALRLEAIAREDAESLRWNALVNATFRLETGNGTSKLWKENYNAGGIRCGSGWCKYNSPEEGRQELANLLEKYVVEFGYDIRAIRNKYCPGQPEDYPKFIRIYNEELSKLGG